VAAVHPISAGDPRPPAAPPDAARRLPAHVFRYVVESSALHQILILVMTVAVFFIELVPLELQRRIVNDLAKDRAYSAVLTLCLVYAGVVLVHGTTKLFMNIYRGWVGETAVRDLRRRVQAWVGITQSDPEAAGLEISLIVAEVEPVGAFVGDCLSEPVLQGGVLLSVLAYMIHIDVWMAMGAIGLFVPQLVFVPIMQRAIIRRTTSRIRALRGLSVSIASSGGPAASQDAKNLARVDRVFVLDMGIFKLKFSLNFLMNLCNHLQIVCALAIGGWLVYSDQLEIGGVVAFISGVGRLNDPWGDLVNYFRDASVANAKYRLIAGVLNGFSETSTATARG